MITHRAKEVARRFSCKKLFLKLCKIYRKITVSEPLFNGVARFFKKKTLTHVFSVNFAKFFKTPLYKTLPDAYF